METKGVLVEKIFLEDFISTLIEIYDKGVEFIDLSITKGKIRDRLDIIVKDEYFREAPQELTLDKLNDLLNG